MLQEKSLSHALPLNYELGAYKIEGYLGQGGFGITYLARHNRLQDLVAIKEYFPAEYSLREQDSTVIPKNESEKETYAWGLERFLGEAKILARFKHPNIVSVRDYFEMNGTGYIVMEYERGCTFKDWLKTEYRASNKPPSEQKLLDIILPILDALDTMHKEKFLHRDIKPDNIYIRSNGTSVLIDFGATRQALGDKSQSLSMILSPGYAPKEQYSSRGNFGPWTDIYAMSATLYFAVTGHKLPSSTDRGDARDEGENDPLVPVQEICKGLYSTHFLQTIDAGLSYLPKDRPQTAKEFQMALQGKEFQKPLPSDDETVLKLSPFLQPKNPAKKIVFSGKWLTVAVIGIAVIAFNWSGGLNLISEKSQSVKTPEIEAILQKAQADMESTDKVHQRSAIRTLTELAETGDADAMRLLGFGYYQGIGIKQDYKQGCQWYEQAADAGDQKAQELYEKSKHCDRASTYKSQLEKITSYIDMSSVKMTLKRFFIMLKKQFGE